MLNVRSHNSQSVKRGTCSLAAFHGRDSMPAGFWKFFGAMVSVDGVIVVEGFQTENKYVSRGSNRNYRETEYAE